MENLSENFLINNPLKRPSSIKTLKLGIELESQKNFFIRKTLIFCGIIPSVIRSKKIILLTLK